MQGTIFLIYFCWIDIIFLFVLILIYLVNLSLFVFTSMLILRFLTMFISIECQVAHAPQFVN